MEVARGTNRTVFLVGNVAIKLPNCRYGLHANKIEAMRYRAKLSSRLARLYLSLPFGLCNIMQRAYIPPNWNRKLCSRYIDLFLSDPIYDSYYKNFGFVGRKFMVIDYA